MEEITWTTTHASCFLVAIFTSLFLMGSGGYINVIRECYYRAAFLPLKET